MEIIPNQLNISSSTAIIYSTVTTTAVGTSTLSAPFGGYPAQPLPVYYTESWGSVCGTCLLKKRLEGQAIPVCACCGKEITNEPDAPTMP